MKNRFEKCLADGRPVLLAFLHAGRQDAVKVKYDIKELRDKYGDKATFLMVDGSYNRPLARKYKIDTYPSWVLFKDGQEVWRDSGTKNAEAIEESVNGFIS
ncbi:MAG: thioredoxin family protein [Bacteroidales bacterium]|nr:thioredoxin family protein [Bacteroidales bacterium]MBD5218448.1 thioredoxin family protein [Bacteroidales bacterium]MBD5220927.1 thioredoxin family protein [Bacteroidales bacterium]